MKVFGIMITYRRPRELAAYLGCLATQPRVLDRLLVVDNAADDEVRRIVDRQVSHPVPMEYLAMPDNLGPAGGIAVGMQRVVAIAGPEDWMVVLDDDDPPWSDDILGRLRDFAVKMASEDPRTAAVAITGARWDTRRARLSRPRAEDAVLPVDYLGGDGFPFYSVRAISAVGVPDERLFFGFDDLEIGLRLRSHGYSLYLDGPLVRERAAVLTGSQVATPPPWRRYYGVRNLLYLSRSSGGLITALKVTLMYGLASPLLAALRGEPRAAARLRLSLRACWDGWLGRLGRRVQPGG